MDAFSWTPPGPTDSRSPCPALNTLSNYHILPHNGKNISLGQLVSGLRVAYNLSTPLCYILALTGLIACGTFRFVGLAPSWTLDLENLALHNRIEHDASIVHADAAPHAKYAPRQVDPTLYHEFVASCPPGGMTKEDFVRARVRRELTLSKPLNLFRSILAASEAVSAFDRVRDPQTGTFTKEGLEAWFGENRFPAHWHVPDEVQTVRSIASETTQFRKEVEEGRKAAQASI
ncbi:Cloroperoxidase [Punctularia strigosozonata HHB-11173 SS5]|uniref:Cloroperoxidase n=1 Tax=Punctularia strigosozonata (strain HHB-11173) TaxID=741275 RepID=R7S0C8_PUNST|nr:Cloroperoxidase [Punctularia strigosozonata HHB-11173 SS5]EIN03840.1 Cloroperoxidase [Punctularia strigosozonata HHB-11173 SS5]